MADVYSIEITSISFHSTCTHLCIWTLGTIGVFPIPCIFLGLLSFAIFCHLQVPYWIFLHLRRVSSSHTFTGGLSLVGIHQGPSLSPAMPQCQWTMVGQRQLSLLVCGRGWVVCAPMSLFLTMHITSASTWCIYRIRKCRFTFTN